MKLYTICIDQRPVVVMSTDAEPPMEDARTTNAVLMKAARDLRAMRESLPDDVLRSCDQREIDEALDSRLGQDLLVYGLWDGDSARLHIRDASADEAQHWHASLQEALDTGEEDAGEESWLIFLVPVREPE
jgi:hypothetical protein